MSNQQLRDLEEGIKILCKNARFGDGCFWIHPECVNYKLIWSSITLDLLQAKVNICPEIFGTLPKEIDTSKHLGRYKNGKPIYRVASLVNPLIAEYQAKSTEALLTELTIEDVALWYLDDGGCFIRKDVVKLTYRYYLCVGNICNTKGKIDFFLRCMSELFNVPISKIGKVRLNNSKATEDNKTWFIPIPVGRCIANEASKFNVLHRKIPQVQSSETMA